MAQQFWRRLERDRPTPRLAQGEPDADDRRRRAAGPRLSARRRMLDRFRVRQHRRRRATHPECNARGGAQGFSHVPRARSRASAQSRREFGRRAGPHARRHGDGPGSRRAVRAFGGRRAPPRARVRQRRQPALASRRRAGARAVDSPRDRGVGDRSRAAPVRGERSARRRRRRPRRGIRARPARRADSSRAEWAAADGSDRARRNAAAHRLAGDSARR